MTARTSADYLTLAPGPLAVSAWIDVDQARVNAFADATRHPHWLHTDPDRAATESPYGGTVAHGFLVLSFINHAIDTCGLRPTDSPYALNYGADRVRFLAPMPIGTGFRVRDRISLIEAKEHAKGLLTRTGHVFEIERADNDHLACVSAEYLSIWVPA